MCKKMSLREFSHIPRQVGPKVQERINALKIGQKMQDLPEELWHESFRYYVKEDPSRKGGPNLRIIRLDPSKPSLTVTGYIFNKFVHPTENRYITPREAARLQGFPDDFLFCGNLTSVQRQVGNAVPVQLAASATKAILEHIEQHNPFGLGLDECGYDKFPAISLFSGAGGMDIGVTQAVHKKMAFEINVCVEFDHDCCETLRKNFRNGTHVVEGDIALINPKDVVRLCNTRHSLLPLVIGGPPCQAFSQAGKQKGTEDARGKLIFEFLRFIEETQPVYFIMENVANIRAVAKGKLFRDIQERVDNLGYNLTSNLLSAANYGAAQLRKRFVFIGVKKPIPAVPAPPPTHGNSNDSLFIIKPYVTVRDAFKGLPSLDNNVLTSEYNVVNR